MLALPIVLFGEVLTARVGWLRRSNVPASIVGGLMVALALLFFGETVPGAVALQGNTANPFWLWSVLPQWNFAAPRATDVELPLLILFFTCIGLNASWRVAKQGGVPLLVYLALAAGIAVLQAAGGAATALVLGEKPLLGIMGGRSVERKLPRASAKNLPGGTEERSAESGAASSAKCAIWRARGGARWCIWRCCSSA